MEQLTKRTIMIRNILKWLGGLVILHVIGLIAFSVFFSAVVNQSVKHEDGVADTVTVLFAFGFLFLFSLWDGLEYARDNTARHKMQTAVRETDFLVSVYWVGELRPLLYKLPIYLAFQLPMVFFYAMWGYAHQYQTVIEKLYVSEAGFYLLTGNAVLGWLLSGAILTLLYAVIRFVAIHQWRKDLL